MTGKFSPNGLAQPIYSMVEEISRRHKLTKQQHLEFLEEIASQMEAEISGMKEDIEYSGESNE